MTICEEILALSSEVRNWILDQPEVKEESLTDWLLRQMSKVQNISIISRAFNRMEEARTTGADWEWWYLFRDANYKMRIQAKKVSKNKNNYPDIARSNKYGMQIDKLLQDAIHTNSIPFYAFYTSETEKTMCKNRDTDEGVFIVGANKLYESHILSGPKKLFPKNIINISLALSCFFCCPLVREQNGFSHFLERYYEYENFRNIAKNTSNQEKSRNIKDTILGKHSSIPQYQ